jgi:hypothetical protein
MLLDRIPSIEQCVISTEAAVVSLRSGEICCSLPRRHYIHSADIHSIQSPNQMSTAN